MIVITLCEWGLEAVLCTLMMLYFNLIHGHQSRALDRINHIIVNFIMFSVLPLFHLMGDNYYRTLVLEHGYVKALWKRLLDLNN